MTFPLRTGQFKGREIWQNNIVNRRAFVTKKSRFTEQRIALALRQAETGTKVAEVCRKMGVAEATFYNWKQKYGGLGVSELRCLTQLEEETSEAEGIGGMPTDEARGLQYRRGLVN